MNVISLGRFSEGPNARIPPLSDAQRNALKIFDQTCQRLALHMILDPGDIQLLSNMQVYHARTAFKDYPPGSVDERGKERVRRHLMRLWLAVPESEGGWYVRCKDTFYGTKYLQTILYANCRLYFARKTPFHDSNHKKRGGVQVNDTPPICPFDAE